MIEINYARALELVDAQIAKKGADYIYTAPETDDYLPGQCLYMHGDEPGCIMGHILMDLGFELNSGHEGMGIDTLLVDLARDHDLRVTDRAAILLSWVQWGQDNGESWGEARAEAVNSIAPDASDTF